MKETTVEEMNRAIAVYLGWQWNERGYYHVTNMDVFYRISPNYCPDELEFNKDWAVLLPVWQKLRGELVKEQANCDTMPHRWSDIEHTKNQIEIVIAQDTDITTAHRLIVEAIELIKE